MHGVSGQVSIGNRILAALPQTEFSRIKSQLESVYLEKGRLVYLTGDRIRYVYFPVNGLLSLLSATKTGSTVEVAMVGNEGIVGLPLILKKGMISRLRPLSEMHRRGSELSLRSRGKIEILNRAALEENSCECYRILRDERQQFLGGRIIS